MANKANNNKLTAKDATFYDGIEITGDTEANNNTISLTGVTLSGDVSMNGSNSDIVFKNNIITVNDSELVDVLFFGFDDSNGDSNKITVNNSTMYNITYVGTNNTVQVTNTSLDHSIKGLGYNNRVIIGPGVVFRDVYGTINNEGYRDGNILDVYTKNMTIDWVKDFEYWNFYLPADTVNGDTVFDNSAADVGFYLGADPKVGVTVNGYASSLNVGDTVVLVDKIDTAESGEIIKNEIRSGSFAVAYDFDVVKEDNQLLATLNSKSVNEETKAVTETVSAGMALVGQASDLISGKGMISAVTAANASGSGAASFSSVNGGSSKYKTGSYADVSGLSLMTGFAKNFDNLLAGAFLEFGYGHNKTHNDFVSGVITGKGDSTYYGVGLMSKYDFSGVKGLYAEGSIHGGYIKSDWKTEDLGGYAKYDTSSAYMGAHAGPGYARAMGKDIGYDVYGKFIWNHKFGDKTDFLGDEYDFKASDSYKTRFGGKLNLTSLEKITPYIGAAWDHEYNGKAKATVYGYETPSPSLKGDTGIFEIGFSTKKAEDAKGGWNLDFGVEGYTGKRKGLGASLEAIYEF